MQPYHLTVDIVLEIHAKVIAEFGGLKGVRDISLLESAIAAPQASFSGVSPYADSIEIAAAYLFFICKNHPFVDGNKRTALGACIVFLRINGMNAGYDNPSWEQLVMQIASSTLDLKRSSERLRTLLSEMTN